ncbi:MAG: hypothetical protein JSU72_08915 [Deltaproteobacteria bacterium]|nr:MAG: hypothetical protein JSU72_08915 [Deltaproteobacteria bacterium]
MSTKRLEALLQQCQEDTAKICGQGAANRLGNWRWYIGNQPELVAFIRRCLRGDNRKNGWQLHTNEGLSLESIVLDHCPELFNESDLFEARRTLGIYDWVSRKCPHRFT